MSKVFVENMMNIIMTVGTETIRKFSAHPNLFVLPVVGQQLQFDLNKSGVKMPTELTKVLGIKFGYSLVSENNSNVLQQSVEISLERC